jgi:threonine dehydratase
MAFAPLVSLDQIRRAADEVRGRLHRTPVTSSSFLGARSGTQVFLKLELFQKTGSFKARGVLNALASLNEADRARGVISISAGNHAQALAWGASSLGIRSVLVMPTTAVRNKIEATKDYGGEVVLTNGDLLQTCLEIQAQRDLTLIHPFDDPRIIAGAGTVGLELVEDVPDVDVVIVGCGGGGLLSGVAAAVKRLRPTARVVGVEPTGANGMIQSLARGEPVRLPQLSTIADGLAAPFAGAHTLAHVRAFVDDMVEVEDDEIVGAMRVLLERCKLLAEPAGAAATAALLAGRVAAPAHARVAIVISGGNVDLTRLRELLAPAAISAPAHAHVRAV